MYGYITAEEIAYHVKSPTKEQVETVMSFVHQESMSEDSWEKYGDGTGYENHQRRLKKMREWLRVCNLAQNTKEAKETVRKIRAQIRM